ncbi:MAG: hypothetical protein NT141_03850 [candidate division WWE3 bacterium]|nr:hypothetical protein [candidate division WWE3 bacterium]
MKKIIPVLEDSKPKSFGNNNDPYTFLAEFCELNTESWQKIENFSKRWDVYIDVVAKYTPKQRDIKERFSQAKEKYESLINKVRGLDYTYANYSELEELNKDLSEIKVAVISENPGFGKLFNYLPVFCNSDTLETRFTSIEILGHPEISPKAAKIKILIEPTNQRNWVPIRKKLDSKLVKDILTQINYPLDEKFLHQWVVASTKLIGPRIRYEATLKLGEPSELLVYAPNTLRGMHTSGCGIESIVAQNIWRVLFGKNDKIRLCRVCGRPASRPNSKTCKQAICRNRFRSLRNRKIYV